MEERQKISLIIRPKIMSHNMVICEPCQPNTCNILIKKAIDFIHHAAFADNTIVSSVLQELNDSFVLHAWNVFSADSPIRVGARTLYDLLSSANCPITKTRVVDEGRVWDQY